MCDATPYQLLNGFHLVSDAKNSSGLFRARWFRQSGGFRWEDVSPINGRSDDGPYLVARSPEFEIYNPLEEGKLFLTFNELEDANDILAFANRYGSLDYSLTESFSDWQNEITAMAETVLLWENWKDGKKEALEGFFHWDGDTLLAPNMYDSTRRKDVPYILNKDAPHPKPLQLPLRLPLPLDGPNYFPLPERNSFRPGDVLAPAKSLIEVRITMRIDKHVRLRLQDGEIFLNVNSLLGAMWFQFAEAIAGRQEYKRCKKCEKWMIKYNAQGKEKLFCSNACKQALKNARHRAKPKQRSKQ